MRVLGRLLLVLLSIIASLAMVEIALRFVPAVSSEHDLRALHEVRPDRPWLYGMRPGAEMSGPGGVRYVANADGFRDRRYARPKPPGTFRVLVVGCSIAFGYGVAMEETFPKQLEARLAAEAPATRIEVVNLGVSGYNPYTEAALLADVGMSYQPDLVLVGFCINDLNDPTLHFDAQTVLRLGTIPDAAFPNPERRRPLPPPASLGERVCRWSRLCAMVADHYAPLPDALLLQAALVPHDDPSDAELAWLRARYGEMAATAAAAHAGFVVVVFPYRNQVHGEAPTRVQERLRALGQEAGWTTIDLLPALRAAARSNPSLFVDIWHLDAVGHGIVADALLTQLRCDGLLPLPAGDNCGERARPLRQNESDPR
jgi:lysophospholipase L1-like esterase